MNTRSMWLSALIAGTVMGLLGGLPLLNMVNCFLCIWVWLGGALAAWLYRRYELAGPAPSGGQSAGLGALAGLVGAGVCLLVFVLTGVITAPLMANMTQALKIEADMPMFSGGFGGILVQALIFLVLDLLLYPLFGALGALVAARLLWKR